MSKESRVPKTSVSSAIIGLMCLLVLVAVGLLSKRVEANTTHCSLEMNDKKRNACFESNPQQRYEQRLSGWPILKISSYASGKPKASATRNAEEYVMCGATEGTTTIGLHCDDDGMKVVFSMGCSFGQSNAPTTLELQTATNSSQWTAKILRNRLGMSIEDSILANKFVQSMQGHDKVILVYTPMDAPKFAATFKLDGFDKAVARIGELCPI